MQSKKALLLVESTSILRGYIHVSANIHEGKIEESKSA